MSTNILVIGSTNTDMVVKAPHFPAPGETILGGTFMMNSGGKGANQAVAASRLGGLVTFITKVGDDIFGKKALQQFRSENLDSKHIFVDKTNPSGVALITVDSQGENSIVVAPGANATLSPQDLEQAKEAFPQSALLLMQLEIPLATVIDAARRAVLHNIKIILNPAPATDLPDELLSNLFLITPNRSEAELLTGIKIIDNITAESASKQLLKRGVKNVVITLGSQGAFLANDTLALCVVSQKVQPVDTTAAGDVFSGAMAVSLSEGKDIQEAVAFANRAAALSVTRMGAQSSIPTRQELEKNFFKID